MATLTAFKLDTADGAHKALDTLVLLPEQALLQVLDAALVSWPKGKSRPSTQQAIPPVGCDQLDGAFWGMLFGLIFFEPVLGRSVYSRRSALAVALSGVGIGDSFIYQIRSKVTEGTSALFVVSTDTISKEAIEEFRDEKAEVFSMILAQAEENRLRELFGQKSSMSLS